LPYAPKSDLGEISRGAYVLAEPSRVGIKKTKAVIIATGSEVQLALKAQELLAAKKIGVRVVSMPSTTTFDRQTSSYKSEVLPAGLPRVALKWAAPMAGGNMAWQRWSVSTPMASLHPHPCSSNTLASRQKTWPRPCKRLCRRNKSSRCT